MSAHCDRCGYDLPFADYDQCPHCAIHADLQGALDAIDYLIHPISVGCGDPKGWFHGIPVKEHGGGGSCGCGPCRHARALLKKHGHRRRHDSAPI